MLSRVLFVVFSLMFDRTTTGEPTPWVLLGMLTCLSAAVLCLVVATKPYPGTSDMDSGGMSDGDRQMVLAQSLQLVTYIVGGLCVWSEARQEVGQSGPGSGVEIFSTIVGLVVVLVQATPVFLALVGRGDGARTANVSTSYANPMANPVAEDPTTDSSAE